MAITAKFIADFSSFSSAVDAAQTTLTGFQGNAGKVESALNRMVANFSGVKVVQEATLMTAALKQMTDEGITPTADALELAGNKAAEAAGKLRALGQDVPPQMQALADSVGKADTAMGNFKTVVLEASTALGLTFGVQAVVGFAKQFVEGMVQSADSLVNMSEKTGISIEQLQRMAFVGKETGVSLDEFSQAAFKLGANIAGGKGSVKQAAEDLGLQWEKLKSQSPEEQFNAVIEALGNMSNVQDRNRIGIELFGKSFSTIVPAVVAGYKDIASGAVVSSEAQIKAIKAAGDAWDRWYTNFQTKLKSAAGDALLFNTAIDKLTTAQKMAALEASGGNLDKWRAAVIAAGTAATAAAPPHKELAAVTKDYVAILADATAKYNAMTPATKAAIDAALKVGAAHKDIENQFKLTSEELDVYIEKQRTSTETQKKAAEQAASYAKTWQTAMDNLKPVLESSLWDGSIEGALKLGGSVHDLAILFNTSEGVIREHQEWMKVWGETVKVESGEPLDTLMSKLKGTSEGLQKVASDARMAAEPLASLVGKLGGMGAAAKPALDDLDKDFGLVNIHWKDMEQYSEAGLQHTADVARETYDFMRDHAYMFSQETIAHFHELAIAADAASGDIGAKFTQALKGAEGDIASTLDAAVTGGDVGGAATTMVKNFATNIVKGIPIIGDAMSKFVGPIVDGIKKIFGGPSADELAARQTFDTFQKQFGTLSQTIAAVGDAYVKAGKTGVQAQQDLQKALDATHVSAQAEADALKTINDVMDSQKQDQADLTAAVQKYGFSIEELGPAMQKQQLDQQATTLLNDWRLLVGSGISLATVNEHMASSMNDYLKQARDTGQEVPEAMKPILQKMVDAGELTDDAGNKITDLQDIGVGFSESMTEGFQKVVDKLTDLINKMPDLAASFANIPGINIPVTYVATNTPASAAAPHPPGASGGGEVTGAGVEAFAAGGGVGTDTVPAILTPGEVVLNDNQQKQLLGLAGGGGAAEWKAMADEIRTLRESQETAQRRLPNQLAVAITSAMLQAKVGRR